MKLLRDFAIALAMIAFTYVGSYVALSLCGRYEATVFGAAGPRLYGWMPAGFSFDLRYGRAMQNAYYPLHWLDCRYWHETQHSWTYERRCESTRGKASVGME